MASRTIIITGAASSLGRSVAIRFSKTSDKLLLTDQDRERGEAVCQEVIAKGGEATFIAADLHEALDVHNVMAEAIDSYGKVDVLVHTAHHYASAPLLETSEQDFDAVMDGNVRAAFLINKAVARQLIRQAGEVAEAGVEEARGGAIVNVVSNEAVTVDPDSAIFAASQGAVVQLTKAVAMTLSPYGARANAVAVSGVKGTHSEAQVVTAEQRKESADATPLGRRGEPKEVASAIHFLSAPDASFITGQMLIVDGGRLTLSKAASADSDA